MAKLKPMSRNISLAIIISLMILVVSLALPFLSIQGYTEENYKEHYYSYGFQSIPPYLALIVGIMVAGFGMGISKNKTLNITITVIAAIIYILLLLFISVVSTISWGNGYSYSLSYGFFVNFLGALAISFLSIANSARSVLNEENSELLD